MKTYIVAITALLMAATPVLAKEKKGENKKEQVRELLKSIETGDAKPVGYINPKKYIQHNLGVEDGLEGFGKLLGQLPKGSAK